MLKVIEAKRLCSLPSLPQYDDEFQKHIKLKHLLLSSIPPDATKPCEPADKQSICNTIKKLNNNKAADITGLSAEHLKHSHPIISDLLTCITNRILIEGQIPDYLKCGVITPVVKKNKNIKRPDSYRRITVTPIIGKVIEKEILKLTEDTNLKDKNQLQFGFTKGVSPPDSSHAHVRSHILRTQ